MCRNKKRKKKYENKKGKSSTVQYGIKRNSRTTIITCYSHMEMIVLFSFKFKQMPLYYHFYVRNEEKKRLFTLRSKHFQLLQDVVVIVVGFLIRLSACCPYLNIYMMVRIHVKKRSCRRLTIKETEECGVGWPI